ncbi:MAG TPA: AraC family transcriptional regulator [Polyangiaceae bacterium]|nr:AraC family transcriptional regulator [Polyangiaceae bacterium]
MSKEPNGALFQSFLPLGEEARTHVWKFSWQYGGRRPRHFHAEPELNLIVAGSAKFGVGQEVISASKGDLLGFPPGQDHVLLETSSDLYLFAIGVEPKLSESVLRKDRAAAMTPLHVRLSHSDFKALTKRAEVVVDRSGIDHLGAELWEHANWVRSQDANRWRSPMHVLTRKVLALMMDDSQLSRDDLARYVRAAPSAISRYFHHDLGLPLVQYRMRLRLMHYIRLMDAKMANLTTAAKLAGFGSYSQCHRVFQSELGCSPRQFFYSATREQMQRVYDPEL